MIGPGVDRRSRRPSPECLVHGHAGVALVGRHHQRRVRWREDRSRNAFENAAFSADTLRRAGVPSALLVTHSLDMPRALWSFRAVGYPVVPAAPRQQTIGRQRNNGEAPSVWLSSFFPQVPALLVSYNSLHELIGLSWYLHRYGDQEVRPRATVGIPDYARERVPGER